MIAPVLCVRDALVAFDRWNDGNPGPAYGRVVLYAAERITLEELVRAVLADQGLDPEGWEHVAGVVAEAFEEWMHLEAPFSDYHRRAA